MNPFQLQPLRVRREVRTPQNALYRTLRDNYIMTIQAGWRNPEVEHFANLAAAQTPAQVKQMKDAWEDANRYVAARTRKAEMSIFKNLPKQALKKAEKKGLGKTAQMKKAEAKARNVLRKGIRKQQAAKATKKLNNNTMANMFSKLASFKFF